MVKADVAGSAQTLVQDVPPESLNLRLRTDFNQSNQNESTPKYAAEASVGSNSNVSVSIASGEYSEAKAAISASVNTCVDTPFMLIPGAVEVVTNAKSFADAQIVAPKTSVKLIGLIGRSGNRGRGGQV